MEMVRSMLKYLYMLNYFWGEVIYYVTYFLNRIVIRILKDKILYEVFRVKKLNIDYLRNFGCIVYVKIVKF